MVEQGVRQCLTHLLAKCHRAQTNRRDLQLALTQLNGFHGLVRPK